MAVKRRQRNVDKGPTTNTPVISCTSVQITEHNKEPSMEEDPEQAESVSVEVPLPPESADPDSDGGPITDEKKVETPTAMPGQTARPPLRRQTHIQRRDHLQNLLLQHQASVRYMNKVLGVEDSSAETVSQVSQKLHDSRKQDLKENPVFITKFLEVNKALVDVNVPMHWNKMEVRLEGYSYEVPVLVSDTGIRTVYNSGFVYKIIKYFKDVKARRLAKKQGKSWPKKQTKTTAKILNNIDLVLRPGKMYLVLGPPASGKTTLLRALAGTLPETKNGAKSLGKREYNGITFQNDSGVIVANAISYVDQIDRHAPRLTVKETFDFAFQCRSGGSHVPQGIKAPPEAQEVVKNLNKEKKYVHLTMEGLGLDHVADTFVGDSDVRGVSGGQRRRVTLGEMIQKRTSLLCADEISTGLDAASTYDIVQILMRMTKINKMTKIVSLLQPSPETVSLFDYVILLAEGRIIYVGPISQVVEYFSALGYTQPDHVDVADYLQSISTPDGEQLFTPTEDNEAPLTPEQFAEKFRASAQYELVTQELDAPWQWNWNSNENSCPTDEETAKEVDTEIEGLGTKYYNNFFRSTWLNFVRHFTIWRRDKRFLLVNAIKNVVMGISVGAVFYQTDNAVSIFGVLFQGMLFIMLGAMTSAPGGLADRIIHYKHTDGCFYPTFSYVIGRTLAYTPQAFIDCIIFGTSIYWMVGLRAAAANYFIFMATLITFTLDMSQMLGVFASVASSSSSVMAGGAFILLLSILFCGFIVPPADIPNYYSWLYWWNPLAWAYRILVLNELLSSDYDKPAPGGAGQTVGEQLLESYGFTHNGEVFGQQWIGLGFAYLAPYILLMMVFTGLGLLAVRKEGGGQGGGKSETEIVAQTEDDVDEEVFDLPFTPVDLTFKDLCYEVKSSTGNDTLRLLNEVNGIFESGRMCALMGSSGAGKTTLMDVIAMRKTSGTITGEMKINGFDQEKVSFRRCSGYVVQFDVQSPQLTVRETVLFSARLRLDSSDPATKSDDTKVKFVDHILKMLELTSIANLLVGSDAEGGLSFEQNKRLSIAVELAASPSVIFLDEPTSGLDSRAAMIVMKALRMIATAGRTVIATIHQPSSTVFEMFDDLLLLKKGGRAVFFGELGEASSNLVDYFEAQGADPIQNGENPSTWMLSVIGAGTGEGDVDYAEIYKESDEFANLQDRLSKANADPDDKLKIEYETEYATNFRTRNKLMNDRLVTIYWRSPAYNYGRILLSLIIGFILGSVFITNRKPDWYTEGDMSSRLSVIFLSFIITGVSALNSVIPVMLSIRDVFYKHRSAGMVGHASLTWALGVAEKRFIILSSVLFCVVFYFTMGLANTFRKWVTFWGFYTFNLAIYSYFGQCFMCSVRGANTASILGAVFIGINNFFSGLIVRPQYMTGVFQFTYWICPGHYVYEGMVASQYHDDYTPVKANVGSPFFEALGCDPSTMADTCFGPTNQYVDVFFGGKYISEHIWYDALVLGAFLIVARLGTYFALKYFNYTAT